MRNPFWRSKATEAADSDAAHGLSLAQVGAAILGKYSHPASWIDGASTGNPHHAGRMLLQVEELHLGEDSPFDAYAARDNFWAIKTWAGEVGLRPYQLTIDQRYNKIPYVVVPAAIFNDLVLPHLQNLTVLPINTL